MTDNQYCVILAGGAGTRLWPISKQDYPKQFIQLGESNRSFLQRTYQRFCQIVAPSNIIVVTASRYKDIVMEQLPDIPEENVLLEPYARNTAPAIAYATYALLKRNPEATMVVTPCDHAIHGDANFRASILNALEFASCHDVLVTLGVTPTRPDPNFGYIQVKGGRGAFTKGDPLPVKTFTEKPPTDIARVFIDSGEFLWNSGMFVWKASVIAAELKLRMPQLVTWFEGWEKHLGTFSETEFINKAYGGCEKQAIDFGVMEKTDKAWVYPADFEWSDIGSLKSLYDFIPDQDENKNSVYADEHVVKESARCMIITTKKDKLVIVKGLDNYVVVDTDDVLVVCPCDEKNYKEVASYVADPKFEKFR